MGRKESGKYQKAFLLLSIAVLAVILAGAGFPGPARAAASTGNFTVEGITPAPGAWSVLVRFSHPVSLNDLRYRIKFLPNVKIDWSGSKQVGDRVVALRGDFKAGQRHLLTLPGNFKVKGRLYQKGNNTFTMPDHSPAATFLDENTVIERESPQMLHLRVVNLERLTFESISVPPALLPLALAAARSPEPRPWSEIREELDRAAQELGALSPDGLEPLMGAPASLRQLFSAPGKKNEVRAFSIPLTFRKGYQKGSLELIRITAEDERKRTVQGGTRLFRITDLGLTYKLSDNELLVWATSLNTGLPLEGVSLFAFTKEMELFPLGRTDRSGVLVYSPGQAKGVSLKSLGGFAKAEISSGLGSIVQVAAAFNDDVSFIDIRSRGDLKPENINQVRRGKEKVKPLRAHLFTERGVYRPGDKVHFKGTVRQYAQGQITTPEAKSCRVSVYDSKNAKIMERSYPLSKFGTLWGEVEIKPYFPLGTYTLNLKYGQGKDQELSRTFQVQEFQPPRHYAEISFERFERWDESFPKKPRLERLAKIKVKGLYYAGGQVKHGRIRYKISHAATDFKAVGFDEYAFGNRVEEQGRLLESGESLLNEKGELDLVFPLGPEVLNGRYGLKVTASVIDFDGRTSTAVKTFSVEPDFLVGLGKVPPKVVAGVGQKIELVVLDKEGETIRHGKVTAEILQETGAYVRKRNQAGDLYWEYQSLWRRMKGADLELVNGRTSFEFELSWGGTYIVSATYHGPEGREYVAASNIQAEGDILWDDYSNRDKPFESLDLVAGREVYEPGQTAVVYLQPRRKVSRYLVTLEQDRVLSHRVIEAQSGAQRLEIPIKDGYSPNVFVSVLGLAPRGAFPGMPQAYDAEAPGFIFGTINLPVRQKVQALTVKLSESQAELKARPGAKITIDLKTMLNQVDGPARPVPAEVALAVVDESVLALTAFKTPSLEGLNQFDLPLAVFTGELRTLLLHQTPFATVLNRELTGGGGMAASEELETRKYFNPVAFFRPDIVTGADGKATVEFTLPDTITRYRVFAVACDQGSAYANAERDLTAVKDFYAEPGLPRFLTKGDKFTFGLKGFNTTALAGSMEAQATSSDNLKLSPEPGAVDLKPGSTGILKINGQALRPGQAWSLFQAEMGELKDAVKIELPILSGYVLSREAQLGRIKGRTEIKYGMPEGLAGADWSQLGTGEAEVLLTVSGSPFLHLSKGLRYLLRYPYGCVEQTSSGVMPLAALRGLIKQGLVPGIEIGQTDGFLEKGVNRLLAMQTMSGGMGYWPGHMTPHAWGSLYAAFALTTAKSNGINIDAHKMGSLIKYLKSTLKRGPRSEAYRAMVAYVLALNKSLDKSIISQVGQNFEKQSREAKLLLILAVAESNLGNKDKLVKWTREVLGQSGVLDRADEFRARYREPALALLAAIKVLGQDPLTDQAALKLLGGLDGQGIWSSTSDTGWALLALGRYFQDKTFPQEPVKITITQADGSPQSLELAPGRYETLSLDPATFVKNPTLTAEAQGSTDLLYLLSVTLPRPDLGRDGGKDGFIVTKKIVNTDGTDKIKVGDLVEVKVRIEPQGPTNRYVMLDDPLPAGLVAINSALKTEEKVGGSSIQPSDEYAYWYLTEEGFYRFVPNFFEIRDERVLAFRDRLWSGAYEFSYFARAVCAGEFNIPPTKVVRMYSPKVNGYTPATRLIIEEK